MIIDHETQLSDQQALTASGASTDSYDLGYEQGDAGAGRETHLYVNFHATAVGTVNVELQESDTADFAAPRTIASSGVLTGIEAGDKTIITIPPHNGRYLRAYYTLAGTTPSQELSAQIVLDVQSWKAYRGVTGAK